jgi:ubiquinone/menaquinone biosynthesis C-methylase UbiE
MALIEDQRRVWDREYGKKGTIWGKQTLHLPDLPSGAKVIEAGVGNGKTLTSIIKQEPSFVVAYDFSMQALKLCQRNVDVALVQADSSKLPFKDGSFDSAVYYFILDNMLSDGRSTTVKEAQRVIKAGGRILFEDFAVGDFRQKTSKVTSLPEQNTLLKKKGLLCHYFTEDEVRELFGGFSKAEVTVREYSPIRGKDHLLRKIVRGTFAKDAP